MNSRPRPYLWIAGIVAGLIALLSPALAVAADAAGAGGGLSLSPDLLQPLVQAVGAVAIAALVWALTWLTKWIKAKTDNENLHKVYTTLNTVAAMVVREVGQTYVDELKEKAADGRLSKKEASRAFVAARDRALVLLKQQGIEASPELVGTAIEAFVDARSGKAKRPAPAEG
jgi:hypothetical protein